MKSQVELEKERDKLVIRLDKGAALIEEDRAKGKDVTGLEVKWLNLLYQYEAVRDQIRELQAASLKD